MILVSRQWCRLRLYCTPSSPEFEALRRTTLPPKGVLLPGSEYSHAGKLVVSVSFCTRGGRDDEGSGHQFCRNCVIEPPVERPAAVLLYLSAKLSTGRPHGSSIRNLPIRSIIKPSSGTNRLRHTTASPAITAPPPAVPSCWDDIDSNSRRYQPLSVPAESTS